MKITFCHPRPDHDQPPMIMSRKCTEPYDDVVRIGRVVDKYFTEHRLNEILKGLDTLQVTRVSYTAEKENFSRENLSKITDFFRTYLDFAHVKWMWRRAFYQTRSEYSKLRLKMSEENRLEKLKKLEEVMKETGITITADEMPLSNFRPRPEYSIVTRS